MADPISIGIMVALTAAQMAIGAMRKIEGPRLDDKKVTTAEYGTLLPDFWGTRWFQGCPIIWAEDLREKKKKSKTKGGKYTEYRYFGTWAVAIAGHEIDAVLSIKFDEHMVYQTKSAGPISPVLGLFKGPLGIEVKMTTGTNMRIYLGTDDQLPDPRMEAWFEDQAEFGPDTCSANRGTAYIVFQDIPLEKFGNRIPQVSVEAVSTKTSAHPYETKTPGFDLAHSQFSPDYSMLYSVAGGQFEVWDIPTRTKIVADQTTTVGDYAATAGGFIGLNSFFGQNIVFVSTNGGESVLASSDIILQKVYYVSGTYWFTSAGGGTDAYTIGDGITGLDGGPTAVPVGFDVDSYFADLDGNVWAVGDDGSDVRLYNLTAGTSFSVASPDTGTVYGIVNSDAQLFLLQGGTLLLVDPVAETLTDTGSFSASGFSAEATMRAAPIGASSVWLGISEYRTTDLSLIRTINPADWVSLGSVQTYLYDPINNAIMAKPLFLDQVTWLYLDRANGDGVTLGSIVESDAARATCDIDAADLDQIVRGYSVVQGTVKDRISPLLDLHDSIICPHDFSILGKKRGTSSIGTIAVADFAKDGDSPRYVVETMQDTDLPQRMEVKFADINSDQQANTVIALRQTDTTDSVRVQPIDLTTYADTADEAQQKADRFLRRQWNARSTISNSLTPNYLAVEPGDVYDLQLDGVTWTAEVEKITFTGGQDRGGAIALEWRRTFPSLNALGDGTAPGMDGREPDEIFVPGPTKGFVLDIPFTRDAENSANPLLHFGAGSYLAGIWPGATIEEGDLDGEDYGEWQAISSDQKATWGFTTDALGDANSNLWDRGNVLTLNVYGTLSNATEAEVDADPTLNMFALSAMIDGQKKWELGNYTTATLTGTNGTANVYEISGLKRGRRGTEWAIGSHAVGDDFILIEDLGTSNEGLSEVGADLFFKAQTYGRALESAEVIRIDFESESLMPYAPAHFEWTTDGTDLFGEIIRRTRVGGSWTGGSAIPLSEVSEAYEVEVLDGADVVRTITVTGTNTFTYADADLTADGFTVADPPDVNVYQMSDAVGRGFALAA